MRVASLMPLAIATAIVIASTPLLTSCSSDSGSGGNDIVTHAETGWGFGGLVETQAGAANNAQVVLFDDGSAMAIWHGSNTAQSRHRVFASYSTSGRTWSPHQAIDVPDGDPFQPQLATNGNGDVVAVWTVLDANGFDQHIYANSYSIAAGWGTAQALQTSGMQEHPRVAMNDAGTALAVWQKMDALGTKSVVSSRFTVATGWEPTVLVGQNDDLLTLPDVGIDAAGNGVATWLNRPSSGNNDLIASRFIDGVGWSITEDVESLDGAANVFAIALNSAGNGLASWWHTDGGSHGLYASRFDPNSGWSVAEEIGLGSGTPRRLSLALGPDDNAIVVWAQETAETQDIYAAHRRPDGSWGAPQLLENLEGPATQPKVAIDADGDAVAVWLQNDGNTDSVYAAQFDPQNGWGPQLILENENGVPARWFEARSPAVVMNSGGDALVVWTQFDGENYSIYANSFNESN